MIRKPAQMLVVNNNNRVRLTTNNTAGVLNYLFTYRVSYKSEMRKILDIITYFALQTYRHCWHVS